MLDIEFQIWNALLSRGIHTDFVISEAFAWVEVEEKETVVSFEYNHFVVLVLPAYVSLNRMEVV